MTDSELKYACYGILSEKIGDLNTEHFIALVNRDAFDYAQWRKQHLGVGETVDSLYGKICEYSASHADSDMTMAKSLAKFADMLVVSKRTEPR